MSRALLFLCVAAAMAWGPSSAASLYCYACDGNESDCPETASIVDLDRFNKVECSGVLSTVCAKYTIHLLNGATYTRRSCEPAYVGGAAQSGTEFCTFVQSLYEPLAKESLIIGSSCDTCGSTLCNS